MKISKTMVRFFKVCLALPIPKKEVKRAQEVLTERPTCDVNFFSSLFSKDSYHLSVFIRVILSLTLETVKYTKDTIKHLLCCFRLFFCDSSVIIVARLLFYGLTEINMFCIS